MIAKAMVDHPSSQYFMCALPESPRPSDTTPPPSSEFFSKREGISPLQNMQYKSPISPSDSPNGLTPLKAEDEGRQFKFQEYKFYYHFLYLRRKKLKEARSEYSFSRSPVHRELVHKREQGIVKVFVKLLHMRTLLRETPGFPQEVLDFCFSNPTVSDWLKAVGIQSRCLIELIKSHFQSIESLLASEHSYLQELLRGKSHIPLIEIELFTSSWEVLRATTQGFQGPPSPCHFSWTDRCDRLFSEIRPEFSTPNGLQIDQRPLDAHSRRVPSPDPWTKPHHPGIIVYTSVSDGNSNSDPNIYPLTPSPGPPSSLVRRHVPNHTFPRRHKNSPPNPDSAEQAPPPEPMESTYLSEEGDVSSPRNFRAKKLFKRIFGSRIKLSRPNAHQQRGNRTSWILEYPQEPKAYRYKPPPQGSPDTEKRSQSRLDNEVFIEEPAPSPSYPSDTGQTDGSCSPLTTSPIPTDWEINFQEIRNIRAIKVCKFSILSTGNWHGQILLKVYQGQLPAVRDQFFQEVSALRNIRHDNVILFRGACTAHPDLTIATSVKHSLTLHQVIRLSPKHPLDRALSILKEISQAMTYLHDRRIVHQNLTTDTIYLDRSNAKPILFDIAVNPLLDYAGTEAGSWEFSRGYISCMAPEIAAALSPAQEEMERGLPFSDKSDVFAFGSIWYELYTGLYPLQGDSVEVLLFKVSCGVRQTLNMIIGPRGIKEELFSCWNKDPHTRPSFQELEGIIERLPSLQQPKRMPVRSTSHSTILPLKNSEATM